MPFYDAHPILTVVLGLIILSLRLGPPNEPLHGED